MRYQLSLASQEKVLLKDEIEFINKYVLLQSSRFDQKVAIQFMIEGKPSNNLVYPSILVQFIENGFKHSNIGLPQAFIDIEITIEQSSLHFSIKNSKKEVAKDKNNHTGYGLRDVRKQLSYNYPNHQLSIDDEEGVFSVALKIDLHED